MAYIVLTFLGLLALILVKKSWPRKTKLVFVVLVILVGFLVYTAIDLFILEPSDIVIKGPVDSDKFPKIFKGPDNILSKIPWLDIGLFLAMLFGMASKYLFDIIGEKPKKKLRFNKWQFFRPFLVSPIIFITVLALLPEKTSILMILVFAYQNGFFWQTLLYKDVPEKS